jgi:hypothetical protein
MMAMGGIELFVLMLMGTGGLSNDLVSLLDAKGYFESRQIEMKVPRLVELATREPANAKDQVSQLLAMRWLGEEAAQVKKAKDFAEILDKIEQVAQGKKGQDPLGFAADYARMAAVALGSTRVEAPFQKLPDNSLRQDALTWFPPSVQIVVAADFRNTAPTSLDSGKMMREMLLKFVPPQAREEVYGMAEKLGNVRVDRVAFGYAPPSKEEQQGRVYFRLSGKADHKRLVDVLKDSAPGMTAKEQKGFRGQRVTMLVNPQGTRHGPPGMAVVGDTDLIVAGAEGSQVKDELTIAQVLAVRAGREKNMLGGKLDPFLKKTSPQASAIVVGELPSEVRTGFTRGPEAFKVFPKIVVAEVLRNKGVVEAKFQGTLDSADDAKQFTEDAERLRKMAIVELNNVAKNVPPFLPIPPKTFEQMAEVLKSVKVQAKGATVSGRMTIPEETIKALSNVGGLAFGFVGAAGAPPPPPPPKIEIKDKESKPEKKPASTEKKPDQGSSLRVSRPVLAQAGFQPGRELTPLWPAIACLHDYADRR